MARKEFTYRGKTIKEIKEMSLKEFIEVLPAKQRRSLKTELVKSIKKSLKK